MGFFLRDLSNILEGESRLITLGDQTLRAGGGALFLVDLYIIGAIKRSLGVSAGFRLLVDADNFQCAAALLRMNLDTAMRLYALHLVADVDAHIRAVMNGQKLSTLSDVDGKKLQDAYLARRLTEGIPWAHKVWDKTSAFVHFTDVHMFAGLRALDEGTRTVGMMIGPKDDHLDADSWDELLSAFEESSRLVYSLIDGWREHKDARRRNTRDTTPT